MKILVNGANGQLGQSIIQDWSGLEEISVKGFSRLEWDIANTEQTIHIMNEEKPDVVIHCAAYTKVDEAEGTGGYSSYQVNVEGARNVASACQRVGARMVYVSTDYVFDGNQSSGYTESAPTNPLNWYGQTKRLGELWTLALCKNSVVVRTSWLYGIDGANFVWTMLNLAKKQNMLYVVDDQYGSPTYTRDLGDGLYRLVHTPQVKGIVHMSNVGGCTWYHFAKKIFSFADLEMQVVPVETKEFIRPAQRPINSNLIHSRSGEGIDYLPHWTKGLARFFLDGRERGLLD
ncbi:dTDP-4-dehydrorhamnose reductase [Croceifilum oryzae]|uniref:dTDP-4-dehydrorhamnose reductase n=1 Tax=Croceifilum oryzae TaxID=1553429 RepID=A0AAJ1WTK8_9BACL|nr:dTDP-4-dehydrorhamnose reductase [Croceifilum oryzae]MDQ0418508.1 dTDP-4-dehydrorhamnose reductase [Croceifilum oryzae]